MKITIIGGGIVGLATAYALIEKYPTFEVIILEKETDVAKHQTGNNSGVVHSGIYYKPGSLKAKNCVEGKKKLLDFCDLYDVPYQQCQKVLVASRHEELPTLQELKRRGEANGVLVEELSQEELREVEPHAAGLKALLVPQCQIIDYTRVANALAQAIQEKGGTIHTGEKVSHLHFSFPHWTIETSKKTEMCNFIINCAGLYCDKIAKMALPDKQLPCKILPFRGEYYLLQKQELVKGLIYPVPNPKLPFLGVHLTRMIDGSVEAGPNAVLATAREGYTKSDFVWRETAETLTYPGFWKLSRKYWKTGVYEMYRSLSKKAFTKSLNRLVPAIQMDDLVPGGSGVRAQAVLPNGRLVDDFLILQDDYSMHVLNAPSPAATSSLSIGQTIVKKLDFEEWKQTLFLQKGLAETASPLQSVP
ncbi:MAG: L-2-hydroxyglutarate oxidase [Chlamydiia bacterium]|nr:L-2-hydroxyglutarate oxidase [Chlamydiia bacterium]